MKTKSNHQKDGYALMMTLFFSGISLMALAGALQWCSSTARTTERNNRYFSAVSAAEAATEKALASLCNDYQIGGEGTVYDRLDKYRNSVPSIGEDSYWGNFIFSDAQGNDGRTYIERTKKWSYSQLNSQYQGLYGLAASYRIVSNARTIDLTPVIIAGVKQDVEVAAIPVFQFAIFYTMDLEINPDPTMKVTGRVHTNGTLYNDAQGQVTYQSDVTAAGKIVFDNSPLDPTSRSPRKPIFEHEHEANAHSLTLPIGTNNTPSAVRAVVEIPPPEESPNSLIGMQRYYNKADIVILVSNTTVTAKSGNWDSFNTPIPFTNISSFVTLTTNAFLDKREGKWINTTEIDVGKLIDWSAKDKLVVGKLGRDVNSIYVADMRSPSATSKSAIRVKNGQTLPSKGLTVATPNPAYVQGHFNAPVADLGTTNTLNTKPSSIVADAISVQSINWSDANSALDISLRVGKPTTMNAAFLSGIVPSSGARYSGGVENFPRFMENWSGSALTYNGSMVVMFPSQYANSPWGNSGVYSPPIRNWAFDLNFLDPLKLPPGTPMIVVTVRAKWAMVPPNSVL